MERRMKVTKMPGANVDAMLLVRCKRNNKFIAKAEMKIANLSSWKDVFRFPSSVYRLPSSVSRLHVSQRPCFVFRLPLPVHTTRALGLHVLCMLFCVDAFGRLGNLSLSAETLRFVANVFSDFLIDIPSCPAFPSPLGSM